MIANFFNKTKPVNTIALAILLFIIFTMVTFLSANQSFDFYLLLSSLSHFILLLLILFGVNFITTKNNLVRDNSYAILFFVLFLGMFPKSTQNLSLIVINMLLLLSYRRIYSLRSSKNAKEKIFDSCFWLGVAFILNPWCALLLILVYAALFFYDRGEWRNMLIPIIGFLCPVFIYGTYLLAIDDYEALRNLFRFLLNFDFSNYNSLKLLIPISLIIATVLWSIVIATTKINVVTNEFKSSWSLIVVHFLVLVALVIVWPQKDGSEFLFLFFSLALVYTNYLQVVEEKWFKEVFLYVFTALALVIPFL